MDCRAEILSNHSPDVVVAHIPRPKSEGGVTWHCAAIGLTRAEPKFDIPSWLSRLGRAFGPSFGEPGQKQHRLQSAAYLRPTTSAIDDRLLLAAAYKSPLGPPPATRLLLALCY